MEVFAASTGDGGILCLCKKRSNPLLEDEIDSGPEFIAATGVLNPYAHEHRRCIIAL